MDEREMLRLFHIVEHDRGPPYVEARDRLVAEGDRARPLLERQLDDPDAARVQAAQVVLGWMDHAESYRLAADYLTLRADPPQRERPRPLPEQDRIDAVVDMTPQIAPRLIELLLKTDEIPFYLYLADAEHEPGLYRNRAWGFLQGVVAGVVNRIHAGEGRYDRRFQEAWAALVTDEGRPMLERLVAAADLRRYFVSDPRWLELTRRAAWDERLPPDERTYAFRSLAVERVTEELPRIRAALADPATSEESLRTLASAVNYFSDRASGPSLVAILARAQSPELRNEVLMALSTIEERSAIPQLQEVARSDPDSLARLRARTALQRFRSLGLLP